MAAANADDWQNSSPQKTEVYQDEDVEDNGHENGLDKRDAARHGDRALALIGSARVSLTEEDVRSTRSCIAQDGADGRTEQAHSTQD